MYSNNKLDKHNRIKIESVDNFYINASFMKSVIDGQIYAVFAQAPLLKVVEHFWYACYHYNIPKIVMLCALEDPLRGVHQIPSRFKPKDTGPLSTKRSPSPQLKSVSATKPKTLLTLNTFEPRLL